MTRSRRGCSTAGRFLAVNEAATGEYGYTGDAFLAMTAADCRTWHGLAGFDAHHVKPIELDALRALIAGRARAQRTPRPGEAATH